MSSLALDKNNDLYFVNNKLVILGGFNTDLEIVQRVKVRLQTFKNEWYLNTEYGVPYFQDILGNKAIDANIIESIFRPQILNINGIKELIESRIDSDELTKSIIYTFSVTTINNTSITDDLVVF